MKMFSLTKIERLKLAGQCIRAATGIIGTSVIFSEAKPYISVCVLAVGAVSNEIVTFIKEKEHQNSSNEANN